MRSLIPVLIVMLLSIPASSQAPRPRVGLALAGGGAKGLAHIGVLDWLDKNRIPVEAVAGTSMGGLVAGLFASGRSPQEIREFVDGINWARALGPTTNFRNLNYRRKEDQQSYPASIELGLKGGKLSVPAGLNAGHQVGLILDSVGLPFARLSNFDALPTPFRCVATDLLSGDKVVFRDGPLATALRSTMSLPGIFAPVAYRNALLVDGGVVDNIPVDTVRDMKVDQVIAVDLGMRRLADDKSLSIVGVASRSIEIMIRRNELASLKNANLVIEPVVADFASLGFRDVDKIIQRGYEAAEARAVELRKFAVSEAEYAAYLAARKQRIPKGDLTPAFVEVSGGATEIRKDLESLTGKPVEPKEVAEALTRITGSGLYDAVGYREVQRGNETGLAIDVQGKKHGPPFIRPLLILDAGKGGGASFTVAARVAAFQFPSRNSEWRTDVGYGRVSFVGTEYYQFLGRSGFFVAPRAFFSREEQILSSDGQRLADYRLRRAGGRFDLGYNFGQFSELRSGLEIASLRGRVQVGLPSLPDVRGTERIWRTRWRWNSLDSGTVPTSGTALETQLNWQFGSPNVYIGDLQLPDTGSFGQAWFDLTHVRRLNRRWSALMRLQGGHTFAGEVQPFSEFLLGGPLRLSSLETGELRGANVAFGSFGVLRRLYDSPASFIGRVYGMAQYETGDAFRSNIRLRHNGTAGIAAETAIGVIFGGVSYGDRGRGGFYFSIGRIFDNGARGAYLLR